MGFAKSSDVDNRPTVAFATVGCRLNQAETDAVAEDFNNRGFEVVKFAENADVYYINTCTVTGRADRSSRQLIHRARRKNPDALILAVGCFAQRDAGKLAEENEVDIVLGVAEKSNPFEYIQTDLSRPDTPQIYVHDDGRELAPAVGTRVSGRSRAFLKVQDGCDHACAYCAVTLVRGKSRSVPAQAIGQALVRVKNAGFEEVVITGVDVSAWGKDLQDETRDFIHLVEMAAEVGIERVRLSSLEPWELSPERISRLAGIPQWCEHFHISLQSAAPAVLKAMRRETDIGLLKESISELLVHRPDATIGADIIAGFPGETETDFQQTLAFINDAPLHYLHVFPYSIRPDTPAAEMSGHLAPELITFRAQKLRETGQSARRAHQEVCLGKTMEVLIEQDRLHGYTRNYLRIRLVKGEAQPRSRVMVNLLCLDETNELIDAEVIS